jgi:hypothetical protein
MNGKRVSGFVLSLGVLAIVFVFGVRALEAPPKHSPGRGGHEHGVAHLNVAVEGANLHLEFISPSANIVGFEHPPRTGAQKTAVENAVETLKDGESLIVLPAGAQCSFGVPTVDTDIDSDPSPESEGAHPQEHDEAEGHQRHSEFTAEYHFVCEHPEELTGVDVLLFRYFPGVEHIEVRLLTGTKQAAQELTAKNNRISF